MDATTLGSQPVFPMMNNARVYAVPGLSLREWLAGMALAGLATNAWTSAEGAAKTALDMADALLLRLAAAPATSDGERNSENPLAK